MDQGSKKEVSCGKFLVNSWRSELERVLANL